MLWAIDRLDIVDKHRALILTGTVQQTIDVEDTPLTQPQVDIAVAKIGHH